MLNGEFDSEQPSRKRFRRDGEAGGQPQGMMWVHVLLDTQALWGAVGLNTRSWPKVAKGRPFSMPPPVVYGRLCCCLYQHLVLHQFQPTPVY